MCKIQTFSTMNHLTNIKFKNFISVACVIFYCCVFQKINVVMSTYHFTRSTTHSSRNVGLQSEENSANVSKVPEMVIFDLDYVLWPFFVDTDKRFNQTYPTLSKQGNDSVAPFPEAKEVLQYLIEKNFLVSLIGQVERTDRAIDLLKRFDLFRFFQVIELGMEKKLTLIQRIQNETGVLSNNILFIEYDYNKVESDEVLDVLYERICLMYIPDEGLTKKYIKQALFVYDERPRDIAKIKQNLIKEYGLGTENANITKIIKTVRPKLNTTSNHKRP